MTLTIELPAHAEAQLRQEAEAAGQPLEEWALQALVRLTQDTPAPDTLDAELDELARRFGTDAPPLAEDAVARSYEEREAAQL